jgi:hypothetical protein
LVEQGTENPRVGGSIPSLGTNPPPRLRLVAGIQNSKLKMQTSRRLFFAFCMFNFSISAAQPALTLLDIRPWQPKLALAAD